MRDPEKDLTERGLERDDNAETLIPPDSEEDVYEDRLMDARPTGITVEPEDDEG